jgi:hypothetical protein
MHILLFNTTTKTVQVTENTKILFSYSNVPTVKIREEGFYEVMRETSNEERLPVARFPIQNTIMLIEK